MTLVSLLRSPLLAALVALAALPCAAAPPPDPQAAEVEAAFRAIQAAVERRDRAALEQRVHPAFTMLHALGQVEDRATWLALVESGRLPRQTAGLHEAETSIQVVGDTALRSSILRMRNAGEQRDGWLRATATFVRVDGRWLQLRQQSSLLHDAPLTDATTLDAYAGDYAIPGRDGFSITPAGQHLTLRWANGARLPLVPAGPDRFGAGPTSVMVFARDASGRVSAVTRSGPEGPWWTATRQPAPAERP